MTPPDDPTAAQLRGFGALGILAILIILSGNLLQAPLSAILVLLWAWRSQTPWRELGFSRPASWAATLAGGAAIGIAFKLLMKSVVMPLLGAPPINAAYHYLAGNTAALPAAILVMIFSAGIGEEIIFRGYMFERLGKLLGSGARAKAGIVLITAVVFGLAHYHDQGLPGVQQATIVGFVAGTIYAVTGRIWMLMSMHAAFDLTALAIIYWDVETAVAHFFFQQPGAPN